MGYDQKTLYNLDIMRVQHQESKSLIFDSHHTHFAKYCTRLLVKCQLGCNYSWHHPPSHYRRPCDWRKNGCIGKTVVKEVGGGTGGWGVVSGEA